MDSYIAEMPERGRPGYLSVCKSDCNFGSGLRRGALQEGTKG